MKKSLFFALFVSVMCVGGAFAFPTDSTSYPAYATGKPTTQEELSVKDANLKVATTKFVNTKAGTVETAVDTLAADASSADSVVTDNETSITSLDNRIEKPTGANVCPSTCGAGGNEACRCGYISASGPSGSRKWVVIK